MPFREALGKYNGAAMFCGRAFASASLVSLLVEVLAAICIKRAQEQDLDKSTPAEAKHIARVREMPPRNEVPHESASTGTRVHLGGRRRLGDKLEGGYHPEQLATACAVGAQPVSGVHQQ